MEAIRLPALGDLPRSMTVEPRARDFERAEPVAVPGVRNFGVSTWRHFPAFCGLVLGGSLGVVPGLLLCMALGWLMGLRGPGDTHMTLTVFTIGLGVVASALGGAWAAHRLSLVEPRASQRSPVFFS